MGEYGGGKLWGAGVTFAGLVFWALGSGDQC